MVWTHVSLVCVDVVHDSMLYDDSGDKIIFVYTATLPPDAAFT